MEGRGGTQDAIDIDWQEQLKIVASVVMEAVMFLSGARADCLYNSSLLIYQRPLPPKRHCTLQPAGLAAPPIAYLMLIEIFGCAHLLGVHTRTYH